MGYELYLAKVQYEWCGSMYGEKIELHLWYRKTLKEVSREQEKGIEIKHHIVAESRIISTASVWHYL